VATEELLRVFSQLNNEGRTIVLITHEPDVAGRAKRTIRLMDGQVVQDTRSGPAAGFLTGRLAP
jgi:putative ABC transport system ATP-binding protein